MRKKRSEQLDNGLLLFINNRIQFWEEKSRYYLHPRTTIAPQNHSLQDPRKSSRSKFTFHPSPVILFSSKTTLNSFSKMMTPSDINANNNLGSRWYSGWWHIAQQISSSTRITQTATVRRIHYSLAHNGKPQPSLNQILSRSWYSNNEK